MTESPQPCALMDRDSKENESPLRLKEAEHIAKLKITCSQLEFKIRERDQRILILERSFAEERDYLEGHIEALKRTIEELSNRFEQKTREFETLKMATCSSDISR